MIRSDSAVRQHPASQFGATALVLGLMALLYVAPLSAQSAKSLLDLLANPQAQDMPPLVRASNDGVTLAGRLIVETVPRVTLTAHRGDKIAPVDPQRLAAASPDIISLSRIEAMRLPSHFLTTENPADKAVLSAVFAGNIPDYFKNIEPAANAPKVVFLKPDPLTVSAAASAPPAPQPETAPSLLPLAVLAAVAADRLQLPDGVDTVPPPRVQVVAVQPQKIPAATPDLTPLAPVPPSPSLAAVAPPVIKGQPVVPPTTDPVIAAIPDATVPTVPPVVVVPDLTGNDLDLALQAELKRLNCYSGAVDGSFGPGSQGALDLFFQTTGLAPANRDPNQAVLDQLKAVADNACSNPYTAVVAKQPQPPKAPGKPKPAQTSQPVKVKPAVPQNKPAAQAPAKTKEDPCLKNPAGCTAFGG